MLFTLFFLRVAIGLAVFAVAILACSSDAFQRVPATVARKEGVTVDPAAGPAKLVLGNEPTDGGGITLDFDLESIPHSVTSLAHLQLGEIAELTVNRPGRDRPNVCSKC